MSSERPAADHWRRTYEASRTDRLGWYRPRLDASLRLIESLQLTPAARIIDVGGGASTLVDDLLAAGHTDVTVLDLAPAALQTARDRLGAAAARVRWLQGDVLTTDLGPTPFDLWHDRAVFHFLVDPADRRRYMEVVRATLAAGGHVVIGTFAPAAPPRCSGLPVARYTAESLGAAFGDGFRVQQTTHEAHTTPGGTDQPYTYCLFRYAPDTRPGAC